MALTRSNIVKQTKNIIYNSGLGEKPSIRDTTGNATVSGEKVTFSVASGTGDKFRAGHVLSTFGSTDSSDAYGFYVLSVSGDLLTCANGYFGEAIPTATAPGLLEHQPGATEWVIQDAIDNIVAGYLYPEVFDIIEDQIANVNLTTQQSEADALDERVHRAWQVLGGIYYQVPAKIIKNVTSTMSSTNKLITYDALKGGPLEYSAIRRVTLANSTNTALENLIAKGAAALAIDTTQASTQWEAAKNDARERQGDPSRMLWQSFYQAKRQYSDDLAKESALEFKIDRG